MLPLAISIFGAGTTSTSPRICYALLRTVRGTGGYPAPSLPREALSNSGTRFRLDPSAVELSVWNRVLEGEQEANVEAEFEKGRFNIPSDCPVEPGIVLEGLPFAPALVAEKYNRVVCDGAGALWSRGFVLGDAAERIIQCLRAATGRDEIGTELNLILGAIDKHAGLGSLVTESRRLGVVERLYRARPGRRPGLLGARVIKPDMRTRGPCRQAVLYRDAAPLGQEFMVHVTLRSFDNIIFNEMVTLPAGTPELIVEASTHITDIEFTAFDSKSGAVADQFEVAICQSINFSLIGRTRTDLLPKPFRGARSSEDLENRTRIHTGFAGTSAGDRAGGFDIMRHNRDAFEALIGKQHWQGECRWFDTGTEPQVDVIRWMKQRLEDASVVQSFLVDPYLGSEALKRVVLRQGNETVSLTIVVSPGTVDPDAPELDAEGNPDGHVASLVAAANESAHQLCGTIRIVHVRRGAGQRQAFHDRYFGLIDRDGVPRVYLLSNSLSKAAGEWPFAVSELDRVTSWIVTAYVRGLIGGNDRGRSIRADEVWSSTATASNGTGHEILTGQQSGVTDPLNIFRQALWKAYLTLHALEQREDDAAKQEANNTIDELIAKWPAATAPPETFAKVLIEGVGDREQHAAAIADRLKGSPDLQTMADALDDLLVERILNRLAPADGSPNSLPAAERVYLLRRAGCLIALREKGTDLVRKRMNPAIQRYASTIEAAGSSGALQAFDLFFAGLCLILIGLEVALSAKNAPVRHRIGLATDYIHFLARLLRSWVSEELFGRGRDSMLPAPGEAFACEALHLARALRAELNSDLDTALGRLMTDSMLPEVFTKVLHDEPADPTQNAPATGSEQ